LLAESAENDNIVTVGLVADPGTPAEVAQSISENLPEVLTREVDDRISWKISFYAEELAPDVEGRIGLETEAAYRLRARGWDLMVCLTDLPRHDGARPIMADVNVKNNIGLASLPAIGWVRLRQHVETTIVQIIRVLAREKLLLETSGREVNWHRGRRWPTAWLSPVRQLASPQQDIDFHLALTGIRGLLRLLFGMVRDNRPWRLVPSMSNAIAAACGTTAFGIFFPTIWKMADSLSPPRLALINFFAVTALITWVIIHNSLWDRGRSRKDRATAALYNAATVLTLLVGVACMYVVLFVVSLVAAVVVIPDGYLLVILGHPVSFGSYVVLVWLASSMGTIAGALGSSLETEDAVYRATYSKREQQRRARRKEQQRHESGED
jgi:hypothetical protein